MENPTRRRVLAAGFAGTALGLLGGRVASATTPPPPSEEDETGTSPPQRPTPEDIELLGFAQSVELTARDLYQVAIDAGVDDELFTVLGANHRAYADVLSGILGTQSPGRRDEELFEQRSGDFEQTDVAALAEQALDLESTLVATHTELLRSLAGIDGARLVASIISVEARQCTVLADASGRDDDLDALLVNDVEPLAAPQATGG